MAFSNSFSLIIDGRPVAGEAGLEAFNPATGELIARFPDASPAQLDAAVDAARRAFPGWRDRPVAERDSALLALAGVLKDNLAELTEILITEHGKPVADAQFELFGAIGWLQALAGMALPVLVTEDSAERRAETRRVPLGVVGAIAPWNFPLLLAFWKIAPALKAGNTMVLKPSPFTPLTTLRVVELAQAVLPPGVLNVVSGGDALGPWLTAHPGIDKISFTGSTATGRRVMASAADTLKRLTLELGGNDAAIVLADADVDAIVPELFWAAFRNNGQLCVAAKRIYVQEAIYDRFARALADYAAAVSVGPPTAAASQLGPVQNRPQYERLVQLIEDCRAQGYRFLTGGDVPTGQAGLFLPVSIVDNPPEHARVVQEEPFGPLLPLLRFQTVDEAIARANASEYGLAGSVWSADTAAALEVARRLETGTVWINEIHHLSPAMPFAGHKQSGFGVENGLDGLLEYTVPQSITLKKTAWAR